ncbi:MAG: ComEC/Rec2 family competence protein [Kiloniellales bacterium]
MSSLSESAAGAWPPRESYSSVVRLGLLARLEAERERWALWLPVGFGLGVGGYFGLGQEPPGWLGVAGLLLALSLAWLARRWPGFFVAALALVVLTAGFGAAQLRTALVAAPVLQERLGPVWLRGQAIEVEPRGRGLRITLRHIKLAWLAPEETPARVRVTVANGGEKIRPGDWLRLRAILRPPPGPAAPGAFDFARQAYFKRLGGVGFALGRPLRIEPPGPMDQSVVTRWTSAWRLWWSAQRYRIARRIMAALPGEAGAVAAALMTGVRGAIPEQVMQAMRDSGLAHLLAISGLHVGLVAGLLFFGLRALLALIPRLALFYPIKKWAAVAAAAGALSYLLLTGATVPTQRAFLMVGLVLLAVVLDRSALTLRLVAWAALAVLAVAPESLLSASFQMSFAAVTALVAGYEVLRDRRARLFAERGLATRLSLYFSGVGLTSVIAGLATAPFAVYHFNRIAWFGLAANMLAVPVMALWIMPWAIVAFILMPFGAEGLALAPMGWGIDAVLWAAAWVAAWPGAVSIVPAMPVQGLVLVALGGTWLCLWRGPWRLYGLAAILGGGLLIPLATPPDVLASGDGKLFGLRTPDGEVILSSAKVRRFEAETWRRRLGGTKAAVWPRTGESAGGRLSCDPLGCIYRARGQIVALVQDSRALLDDCALATVVISREPLRRGQCKGSRVVIDRFDLWRHGGHALWLSEAGVRIETVGARRGVRPWVPQRRWK